VRRTSALAAALAIVFAPAVLRAQDPARDPGTVASRARAEGLEFERQGRFADAADAYERALAVQPANAAILLSLERVLSRVGRPELMMPALQRAVAAAPADEMIRGLQFRVGARVGGPDSAAAVAARWMAAIPNSVLPYREWSRWLAERGETESALAVLARGRQRFGDAALAEYAAPALAQAADWVGAAMQWATAAALNPALLSPAASSLRRAPDDTHGDLLDALIDGTGGAGHWLAADLMMEWGQPEGAWVLLSGSLPSGPAEAARLVARFADRARTVQTREGLRARAFALERLAQLVPAPEARRARVEAARAFADAGSLDAAQRVLSQVTIDTTSGSADAVEAMATFIRVLADAGRVADAEVRYREWEPRFRAGEGLEIREHIAQGWVARGELDRAESLIAADSSVGALAIQGWVALYRGDLGTARARLAAAGPSAQSRGATTRSAAMLVLLEQVGAERQPALGAALLAVNVGDTAAALAGLDRAAGEVTEPAGKAAVRVFAAGVALAQADTGTAEALLLDGLAADPDGPSAPAAEYLVASIYAGSGRNGEAVERLERLILAFPESAVLPQARRLLDRVRGAVPNT